jgi:hypothetical protein
MAIAPRAFLQNETPKGLRNSRLSLIKRKEEPQRSPSIVKLSTHPGLF